MNVVAIDFETANHCAAGICAVGMAVFENGQLADSYYSLIRPPKGHGWFYDNFIAIHGITHETVRTAPEFPAIAPEIFIRLAKADVVVAHNASFDMRKLHGTAGHFGSEIPAYDYLCTFKLAQHVWPELENYRLPTVAAHIGHKFEHHHAGEDAEACGRILLAMMNAKHATSPRALAEIAGVLPVAVRERYYERG